MEKLKQKKYWAILGIVLLVLGTIGLVVFGRPDKYKGLVKVKNINLSSRLLSSVGSANSVQANGYDEVNYTLFYTLDEIDGLSTRDVVIKGELSDNEFKYAKFKMISGTNMTSNLTNGGKNIEILVRDVPLGEEQKINLKLLIEGAPNGTNINPTILIKEKTGNFSNAVTEPIQVVTNSLQGVVRDENNNAVEGIELSINYNNNEIRRTYTKDDGSYIFSDLEQKDYTIKVEEEIYELVSSKNVSVGNDTEFNLKVRQVNPYSITTHKYIKGVKLIVNGKEENYSYEDKEKVVQSVKNAKTVEGEIEYKIVVANTGSKVGTITRVIDEPLDGLKFNISKNEGWIEKNDKLYYKPIEGVEIPANSSRTIRLILDIEKTSEIKTYLNKLYADGEVYNRVTYILNGEIYREEDLLPGEKTKEPTVTINNFAGWYSDKNYTNKYNFNREVNKDIILYGKTEVQKYDIEFYDKNPSNNIENLWNRQLIEEGKKVVKPNDPSHDGYEFDGWADSDNNKWNFDTDIVDKSVTLYSVYKKINYNISYDGLTNAEKQAINNPTKYTVTDEITLTNPSDRQDNSGNITERFVGWTGSNGETPSMDVTIVSGSTGDKSYTAHFSAAPFTITYHLDGGTVSTANPISYTINDRIVINNPTKDHYTFTGWSGTDLIGDNNTSVVIETGSSGSREYYAHYDAIMHNVTFNDVDPEDSTNITPFGDPQSIQDGNSVNPPATNPDHYGYTCDKWSTKVNGNYDEDAYDFSSEITVELNLYTLCKKNNYKVRFIDGETQFAPDQEVEYKETATRPEEDPEKEYNVFKGWTLNGVLFDFNTEITEDIVLYSSYEEVEAPKIITEPSEEWTNDKVKVTITNQGTEGMNYEGYSYKYRIDGEFVDYTGPFYVTENCDIYAISYKEEVSSTETMETVGNIDKILPQIIDLESDSVEKTSFSINTTTKDLESGMDLVSFYIGDTLIGTKTIVVKDNEEKNITFSTDEYDLDSLGIEIESDTTYQVKIIAKDVAGNERESDIIDVTTEEDDRVVARIIATNNTPLEEENYVTLSKLKKGLEYNNEENGINCITNQCTIQMLDNVLESNYVLDGQDITLDLNGYTVAGTRDYTLNVTGNLTLVDSSEETIGELMNENNSAVLINENGTFTMGVNDVETNVSLTQPYVTGKLYGVRKIYSDNTNVSGTFNFYDGIIEGESAAISGVLNDTPYLYNADIKTELTPTKKYVATLRILSDAVARVKEGSRYYSRLESAVDDTKQGVATTTSTETDFRNLLLNNNELNNMNGGLLEINDPTKIVIDLNDSGNKTLRVLAKATSVANPTISVINYDNNLAGRSATIYERTSTNNEYNYFEIPLAGQNVYYITLDPMEISTIGFYTEGTTETPTNLQINQEEVVSVSTNYGFDYDDETKTFKSNNQYVAGSTAFSYMEIDLTEETNNKELVVSATLDTLNGTSGAGYVFVKEDNNIITSSNPSPGFLYLFASGSGNRSYQGPVSSHTTLTAGKKYYIQFYYFKPSAANNPTKAEYDNYGSSDQFIINSIDIFDYSENNDTIDLSSIDSAYTNSFTKANYYDYYTASVSSPGAVDSFIKIDMLEATEDKVLIINMYLNTNPVLKDIYLSDSPRALTPLTATSNVADNYNKIGDFAKNTIFSTTSWPYTSNGSYVTSTSDQYFILKKGKMYYLHFNGIGVSSGGSNTVMNINSIRLVGISNSLVSIGTKKINSGTEPVAVKGLAQSDTSNDIFRFIGSNPNNYVYFNCDDYSNPSDSTCEKWRIVGVFKTEDENGNVANRVKIARNSTIGNYVWDTTPNAINGGYGINEWSQAKIMKLINPGYDSEDVGGSLYYNRSSGQCYGGNNNSSRSCDFTSTGLKDSTKSFIDTVKWHTAAIQNTGGSVLELYNLERGNDTGRNHFTDDMSFGSGSSPDEVERTTTWYGKVGLLYATDLMYSFGDGSYYNRSYCISSTSSLGACSGNSYLSGYENYWVINPAYYNSAYTLTYATQLYGGYSMGTQPGGSGSYGIKPTLYLSTKTNIDGGSGTETDPYTISLGTESHPNSTYFLETMQQKYNETAPEGQEYTYTDDYTLMQKVPTKPFIYNEEDNSYTNGNNNEYPSISSSSIPIDMTVRTKPMKIRLHIDLNTRVWSNERALIMLGTSISNATYLTNVSDSSNTLFNNMSISSDDEDLSDYIVEASLVPGMVNYLTLSYANIQQTIDGESGEPLPQGIFKVRIEEIEDDSSYDQEVLDFTNYNINMNEEADTVEILKDISVDEALLISNRRNMILDLNGYTLTSQTDTVIENYGELTIIDSSSSKTGKIAGTNGNLVMNTAGSVLTLSGGTLENSGGTDVLNRGTLNLDEGCIVKASSIGIDNEGEIIGTGGTITTTAGIGLKNEETGTFSGDINFNVSGGTGLLSLNNNIETISDLTVTGTNGNAINIQSNSLTKVSNIEISGVENGLQLSTSPLTSLELENIDIVTTGNAFIFDSGIYNLDEDNNDTLSFYGNIESNGATVNINLSNSEINNKITNNSGIINLTGLKESDVNNNIYNYGTEDNEEVGITTINGVVVNDISNNRFGSVTIENSTTNDISNYGKLNINNVTSNNVANYDTYIRDIIFVSNGELNATKFNFNLLTNTGIAEIDEGEAKEGTTKSYITTGFQENGETTDYSRSSNRGTFTNTSVEGTNVYNSGSLTLSNYKLNNYISMGGGATLTNVDVSNFYNSTLKTCKTEYDRSNSRYKLNCTSNSNSNKYNGGTISGNVFNGGSLELDNISVAGDIETISELCGETSKADFSNMSLSYSTMTLDNVNVTGNINVGRNYNITNKDRYRAINGYTYLYYHSGTANEVMINNNTAAENFKVTLGNNDSIVSQTSPQITKLDSNIDVEFNFYDGVITGTIDENNQQPILGLNNSVRNIPFNYDLVFKDEDNYRKITLGNTDPVAMIGTTNYGTLYAAVSAANNSDNSTIELLKDIPTAKEVTFSSNTIFNLNGHMISNYGSDFISISSTGNLNINSTNDEGGITELFGGTDIENSGTTTINSANYNNIINNGTMQINDGTIDYINNKGILTINDNKIIEKIDNFGSNLDTKLYINGGKYTTINDNGALIVDIDGAEEIGKITISNAKYTYTSNNPSFSIKNSTINSLQNISSASTSEDYYDKAGINIISYSRGSLLIDNCNISYHNTNTGSTPKREVAVIRDKTDINATISNSQITNNSFSTVIYKASSGTYNISDSILTGGIGVHSVGATINFERSEIIPTASFAFYYNDTYGFRIDGGTLNFKSGSVGKLSRTMGYFQYGIYSTTSNTTLNMGVKGDLTEEGALNISFDNPRIVCRRYGVYTTNGAIFNLYDGDVNAVTSTFNGTVNDTETGYVTKLDEDSVEHETWTDSSKYLDRLYLEKSLVARLESNNQSYPTVQDAVDAAAAIDKITIIEDIEYYRSYQPITIPSDKNITIDYSSKNILNKDTVVDVINNNGTLTLENTNMKNANIINGGDLTIKSGKLQNGTVTNNNYLEIESLTTTSNKIVNNNVLVINDGTIDKIANYKTETIKGGTIEEITDTNNSTTTLGEKGDLSDTGTLNVSTTSPFIKNLDGEATSILNFYDGKVTNLYSNGLKDIIVDDTETDYNIIYDEVNYPSKDDIITNKTTGAKYKDIQSAINNASTGDVLEMLTGLVLKNGMTTLTIDSNKEVDLDLKTYTIQAGHNILLFDNAGNFDLIGTIMYLKVNNSGNMSITAVKGDILNISNSGKMEVTTKLNKGLTITNSDTLTMDIDEYASVRDSISTITNTSSSSILNINNSSLTGLITNNGGTINMNNSNFNSCLSNDLTGNVNLVNSVINLSDFENGGKIILSSNSILNMDEDSKLYDWGTSNTKEVVLNDNAKIVNNGSIEVGIVSANDNSIVENNNSIKKIKLNDEATLTNTGSITRVILSSGTSLNMTDGTITYILFSGYENIDVNLTGGSVDTINAINSSEEMAPRNIRKDGSTKVTAKDVTIGEIYAHIIDLDNVNVTTILTDYYKLNNWNEYYYQPNSITIKNCNISSTIFGGDITIKDSTVTSIGSEKFIYQNDSITIDNSTINGTVYGKNLLFNSGEINDNIYMTRNITMESGTINGSICRSLSSISGLLLMKSGEINGSICNKSVELKSGTINGNITQSSTGISNLTMDDGTINGYVEGTTGIVKSGTIDASGKNNPAMSFDTITLGEKGGGAPSTSNPVIKGDDNGIVVTTGLNFYDGIVIGQTPILGNVTDKEPGYTVLIDPTLDNSKAATLAEIADEDRVVTYNRINYDSIQSAINSVDESTSTANMNLFVNYTLPEDLVIPSGLTVNLYLNGWTFDYGDYSLTGGGTLNTVEGTYSGVGSAIYRFLANLTGTEINAKDIVIYQMSDGNKLLANETYKLYKLIDNQYKIVEINENSLGKYELGNDMEEMSPIKGKIFIDGIGEGTYKLVSNNDRIINFDINANDVSSNIIENPKFASGILSSSTVATLILTLQTGVIRTPYALMLLTLIILIISGYAIIKKYKKSYEK